MRERRERERRCEGEGGEEGGSVRGRRGGEEGGSVRGRRGGRRKCEGAESAFCQRCTCNLKLYMQLKTLSVVLMLTPSLPSPPLPSPPLPSPPLPPLPPYSYGDMRIAMNTLMINKWRALGSYQSRYVPGMIGPFLKVSLVPHTSKQPT